VREDRAGLRARWLRHACAHLRHLFPCLPQQPVYSKRLREAGWHSLYVPGAEAVHHDQLSTDLAKGLPRIVEFHRNRNLYMRKHHGKTAALEVRALTAWSYAMRALAATVLPGQPANVYWAHARQALFPNRGESIRDRAQDRTSSSMRSTS